MKKLSTLLLILLIGSFGSQTYAQLFGVKGGLNLANQLWQEDGDTYSADFKMKPGFHIGGIVAFPIKGPLFLETGLILDTKGLSMMEEAYGESYEEKMTLYYLDIPVLVRASLEVTDGVSVYGAAGPYFGMGLTGKDKWTYKGTSGEEQSETEDVEWGNDPDNDHFKRPDFGLSLGGGIVVKGIHVGVLYDLGLANISAYTDNNAKINNRVLRVTPSIWFGK
jgi:hypothetical protein